MSESPQTQHKFSLVLPVLFYEYLAISITRAILPGMLVDAFGVYSYAVVGVMETVKGLLAFFACPLFGKLSDEIGRKYCLLATVTGTAFPVCVLAFTQNMWVFAVCVCISGMFSATFPLTFAYISDCVDKHERAPAYGLALATFGLSFCIGPIIGSYLASQFSYHAVFMVSLLLVGIDFAYIVFILPETVAVANHQSATFQKLNVAMEYLPNTWNLEETFRVFRRDSFMRNLSLIVVLYYTSVWAVVSTMMVYVTRHLHFSPLVLGWLLSSYGLSTMFSEGILVRVLVPRIGEMAAMRLGLASFAIQTVLLAFSNSPTLIFVSILFSMISNLVYPSISSLVSKLVEERTQGEALGALNGIKAMTEGFGPLLFGGLMALYEHFAIPGAPYLFATVLSLWALLHTYELPPIPEVAMAKHGARTGELDEYHEGMGLLYSNSDGEVDDEVHL